MQDERERRDRDWLRLMNLLGPIHPQVQATARRLCRSNSDGDDLFQDAVLRALDKLPGLRDESRFRSWFHKVLISVHRSRWRRAFWRRYLSLEVECARGFDPAGEDGDRRVELDRAERASQALATLPAPQREAVVLFELEGFSIEEIADMQKVSPPAVKSRLVRGRERLRRYYQRLGLAPEKDTGEMRTGSTKPAISPKRGQPDGHQLVEEGRAL